MLQCFLLAHIDTAILFFLARQFKHFLLDGFQIFVGQNDPFSRIDIIVKSVFDSRSDTEFGIRV